MSVRLDNPTDLSLYSSNTEVPENPVNPGEDPYGQPQVQPFTGTAEEWQKLVMDTFFK